MYQFLNFFLYSSILHSTMRSFLSGYLSLLQVDNTLLRLKDDNIWSYIHLFHEIIKPNNKKFYTLNGREEEVPCAVCWFNKWVIQNTSPGSLNTQNTQSGFRVVLAGTH